MSHSETVPRRDQYFYWDFVRFNVGDSQFQVPKEPFVLKSSHFSIAYDLHEKSEITLTDVEAEEFKAFLGVLFPMSYSQPHASTVELTKVEWTSVFRLSTRWRFPTLQALALKRLNNNLINEPVQRILLGRTHNIRSWVHRGLCELVLRLAEGKQGAMISEAESEMLGHLTTVCVYQTHYEVSRLAPGSTQFNLEVARRVGERFAEEFSAVSARYSEENEQVSSALDAEVLRCNTTPDEAGGCGVQKLEEQATHQLQPQQRCSEDASERESRRSDAKFREFPEQEQHQWEQRSWGSRRSQVARRHRRRWHAA